MYTCYAVKRFAQKTTYIISVLAMLWLSAIDARAYEGHNAEAQRHFIWAVESGRNTVYLLGSLHVLKQDSYPLSREVEKIFECCKKIVFETDLDEMIGPEAQKRILKRGLYPSGVRCLKISRKRRTR